MSQNNLILSFADGKHLAFRNLVSEFSPKVFSICFGYVQNSQEAEDLAQEVFIEIFQSAHKFKGGSTLGTWIYRIAVNKSLDYLRFKGRQKRSAEERSLDTDTPLELSDRGKNPEQALTEKERYQSLWSAIGALPERQRSALVLCNFDGMSYAEAAEILETSVGSLESLIFRAKKQLKLILTDRYGELFGSSTQEN